jgi:hypothetical protein
MITNTITPIHIPDISILFDIKSTIKI